MSTNINRHQAGATVAGEKTGGQFKAGERTAASGEALERSEHPQPETTTLPPSAISTSWSCDDCGESTSAPLTELPEIGTPVCGDCGDDMDLVHDPIVAAATTSWSCGDCGEVSEVPLTDLPEIGTPVCGECGDDMELGPNVEVSTTAARAALAHQFRTEYGVNEEQMASLSAMFERDMRRTLTDRDREQLMDLADAMEEANFHSESMEIEALVARSEYEENPRMKLSGTRAWSLAASRHTPQLLKDLVKTDDPRSYESAMRWLKHSTRTPFEL